jgi:hypothetical protein
MVVAFSWGLVHAQGAPDAPDGDDDAEVGDEGGGPEATSPTGRAEIDLLPLEGGTAVTKVGFDDDTPQPAKMSAPTPAPVAAQAPPLSRALAPAPQLRKPDAKTDDDVDFDPFAEEPVRAYMGAAGVGSFVLNQPPGRESVQSGGGISVFAGVDLGPWIGIEVGYLGSFHNPGWACGGVYAADICKSDYLVLDLMSVDLRLHLPTGTRLVPFIEGGGVLGWVGRAATTPTALGAGFQAGGGIEGWIGNYFTLGARVLYRGIAVNDIGLARGVEKTFLNLLTSSIDLGFHF